MTNTITSQSTVFTINDSNETWKLAAGQTITSPYGSIYEGPNYHGNTIVVNGAISQAEMPAPYYGVEVRGTETTVVIGETGTITAEYGIHSIGEQFRLVNHGSIDGIGAGSAVAVSGDSSRIINHGSINGTLYADSADKLNIVLGKASTITEDTGNAIEIYNEAGQTARIVNHGLIGAPDAGWALQGGDGKETFINSGTLNGDVMLGAGNDVFDNRGGTVGSNYIKGNEGNDTFVLDSYIQIYELAGEGTDTVKSTFSMSFWAFGMFGQDLENLTLLGTKNIDGFGNDLDNVIKGNSGNNQLAGDVGDDILTGGKGADVFIFKEWSDNDTVHDFANGADRIDLSDFTAVTGFADLMAHHVSKSGLDLIIHDGTNQFTLEHTAKADLQASDFIF